MREHGLYGVRIEIIADGKRTTVADSGYGTVQVGKATAAAWERPIRCAADIGFAFPLAAEDPEAVTVR